MNEYPKTIVITEKTGIIDVLYQLQEIYPYDIELKAKSGEIRLKLRKID